MWRVTQDPIYRQWEWKIFQALQKYEQLEDGEGYTSLNDVNAILPPRPDNMESLWLAENSKYLYSLFSPNNLLPLTDVVFNTEAHVFPVMKQANFTTGWQRRPRESRRVGK